MRPDATGNKAGLAAKGRMWDYVGVMTATVEKIAGEVQALPEKELDQFLSWLADYELAHPDRWDKELERDSQPGGRLDAVLKRVRGDIEAGRTKPLDEVLRRSASRGQGQSQGGLPAVAAESASSISPVQEDR